MARVKVETIGSVATVTLTRPEKMNALDDEMMRAIVEAGQQVAESKARAVVLSGEGRAFCAGLDLESFAKMGKLDAEDWLMPRTHEDANFVQEVALVWRRVQVPVIAALTGVAYGGGLQLALGADIRIAHPETRLSVMEMKWGLVPDMSGTVTLRELMPMDVVKELTFTGRVLTGEQALDLGLITHVAEDPSAKAADLIAEMLERSPDSIAAGKALLHEAWLKDDAGALAAERKWQRRVMGRKNQRIAAQRNAEMSTDGAARTEYASRKIRG